MGNDKEVMKASEEAMERTSQESATYQMSFWANEGILNASFASEIGKIFDSCKETPIYEVLENSRPGGLESTNNFEELQQLIYNVILTEHNESVDCLSESIGRGKETTNN